MPAPEQSPATEEGHLLTIRDGPTGRSMEADSNTANNILASVKEQVPPPHFLFGPDFACEFVFPLLNYVHVVAFMRPFGLASISIYVQRRLRGRLNCLVTHTFFTGVQ